ncbi:MAG: DUF4440 domain-containing protein [Rhodobacteraceae bacterium]|nr:MAG: DUF4440 domain-containing protein [Paracoccaceae bacterium]
MTDAFQSNNRLFAEILTLETQVWQALVEGNPEADGRMLTTDFLGVYPSGFANRAEHCGQLSDGPVMAAFALSQTQLRVISADAVLLSYCAQYRRTGCSDEQVMYISSLWQRDASGWLNSFSQDTPALALADVGCRAGPELS